MIMKSAGLQILIPPNIAKNERGVFKQTLGGISVFPDLPKCQQWMCLCSQIGDMQEKNFFDAYYDLHLVV